MPGIFTYRGFHDVVLTEVEDAARLVASDRWVTDPQAAAGTPDDASVAGIASDALQLYYNDYISAWNALLADIRVVPFEKPGACGRGPEHPVRPGLALAAILRGAAQETALTKEAPAAAGQAAPELSAGQKQVANRRRRPGRDRGAEPLRHERPDRSLLAQDYARTRLAAAASPSIGLRPLPGAYVEERFRDLHAFVEGPNGAAAPLDDMIRTLADVYRQMNRSAMTPGAAGVAANAELGALAQQPHRLGRPGAGGDARLGRADRPGHLQRHHRRGAADPERRLEHHRPAAVPDGAGRALSARPRRQAGREAGRFRPAVRPGGLIDGFFSSNLAQYADTSRNPWRWAKLNNVDLGIADSTLAQFEKAARIRDAFFPQGGTAPSIGFEIEPVDLSPEAASVTLDINGQTVSYDHGPVRPASMRWPGTGAGQVRVSFTAVDGSPSGGITLDGPWALFRLVDRSRIAGASASDRFRLTISEGKDNATFEIRTASVLNPFTLPQLREFQCPQAF